MTFHHPHEVLSSPRNLELSVLPPAPKNLFDGSTLSDNSSYSLLNSMAALVSRSGCQYTNALLHCSGSFTVLPI